MKDKDDFPKGKLSPIYYEDYWEKHDILYNYYQSYLWDMQKESVCYYKKINYKLDKDLIVFQLENNPKYKFRGDDKVTICSEERWKKHYEINSEHLKKINGFCAGEVDSYDFNNKRLAIKAKPEIIKRLLEDCNFNSGYLWIEDIGTRVKLHRENQALDRLFVRETANKKLAEFVPNVTRLTSERKSDFNQELLSENYYRLNEMQQRAVKGAITSGDMYLIQGPPGTGKTTVISEIIRYLINDNKKVLLSSQTNLAVDNVLQRIGDEKKVNAIRIGSEERIAEDCLKYQLKERVDKLQKHIRDKLEERKSYYELLSNDLKEQEFLKDAHKYMKAECKRIIGISERYVRLGKNILVRQKELEELKFSINNYVSNKEKFFFSNDDLIRLKNLNVKLLKSYKSLKENIRIYRAIKELDFTHKEESLLKRYEQLIAMLEGGVLERERLYKQRRDISEEIRSIEKEIKPINAKIINTDVNKSNFEYINLVERAQAERIKSNLIDRVRALEGSIGIINKKIERMNTYLENQKSKTVKLQEAIEDYISNNHERLCEFLGVSRVSKRSLLVFCKELSAFKEEFIDQQDSLALLEQIEAFREYHSIEERLGNLTEKKKRLLLEIASIEKDKQGLKGVLASYVENSYVKSYTSYYCIDFIELNENKELKRCIDFLEGYNNKKMEYDLYVRTEDIQREWAYKLNLYQESFEKIYLNMSNLIGATCLGIAGTNNNYFLNKEFDYVIIDEAARATSRELLIPMTRGEKIVLVGDHKQISPEIEEVIINKIENEVETSKEELDKLYNSSLFGLMYEEAHNDFKTFLDTQFRMHPDIAYLVSELFYDGRLINGKNTERKNHGLSEFIKDNFYWLDTPNEKKFIEKTDENKSRYNLGEIETTENILQWLNDNLKEKKSVSIISVYRAHRSKIIDSIKKNSYEKLDIEVNTIDAIQGREANIIIINLVVNNSRNNIGDIAIDSKLNVALSRAQELLIIVGNREFISKNMRKFDKGYRILDYLEKRGCILNKEDLLGLGE